MHELPITESILNIALNAAADRRVSAINLVVGELSSIVDDSVQFYFGILSKGTPAADAVLHFRRVPGTVTCRACGGTFKVGVPLPSSCPGCGGVSLQVTGGREMRVESIEVDDSV